MSPGVVLVGDVGGTNTRFALHDGALGPMHAWPTAETPSLSEALERLRSRGVSAWDAAAVAVAGPVAGDRASLTNTGWVGHTTDFGSPGCFVNDLAAAAHGLELLPPSMLVALRPGVQPVPDTPRAVMGLGTGLGEAYTWGGVVLGGEGGHRTFAPEDATQRGLFDAVSAEIGRPATWEHVLSGSGLGRIAAFLAGEPLEGDHNAVAARVTRGDHPESAAAMALYARLCATEARTQALQVLARGGVHLVGGMVGRIPIEILRAGFDAAFLDEGPHREVLAGIPAFAVLDTQVGLLGAAVVARRLRAG